jgi:hypothetical protein
MRHTTIVLVQGGKGFRKPGAVINNTAVESMLSKSSDNYVVFRHNQHEYMTFTEQHPLFNILVLREGNTQLYNNNVVSTVVLNNFYYDTCDIVELLYQKATEIYDL